tara:strand:+ start:24978 stop:26051 length:1074 start_codon:yes stop_codon:yes gene_type:complete
MATSFKALTNNDMTRARTKLHEAIPLTGTILSGTYGVFGAENNIKNYTHGMFQSVYDYPYLSSSANHIIDLTACWATDSSLSASSNVLLRNKKNDVYNEMCQMLSGYDSTGSINKLDVSGAFAATSSIDKMDEVVVFNFARLLTKDEIQKQANTGFSMQIGVNSAYATPMSKMMTVYDRDGINAKTNSPAGEFNILYATSSEGSGRADNRPCGLLFYQAGVAILTSSVFKADFVDSCAMDAAGQTVDQLFVSGAISSSCDALRHRIDNISFNNTTELNSTIYFCRANNNEFNYSSNPTYLTSSQIRVKQVATDNPVSYVTTVGLYSEDNALLAVAKVSEPIKKTPAEEYTLRVRLDY